MGQSQNNFESETPELFDRTQELSWALLDDYINGEEFTELEDLLLNDKIARESYIGCVQLHADLASHFAAPTPATTPARPARTPILGFLGTDSGPLTGLNAPKS